MSTAALSSSSDQVQQAVQRLLTAARDGHVENRSEPRSPFFHPATLTYRYREEQPIAAFTRELSDSGIGLLHSVPIERGEVTVSIERPDNTIAFRTFILWCKPCGQWYLSGGQFLGVIR